MATLTPFDVFLTETAAATPEQYAEALVAGAQHAGISLKDAEAEFEKMKAHVLSYYEGVHPVGIFEDALGQIIDCVPFEQQPAVRSARAKGLSVAVAAPPHPSGVAGRMQHEKGTNAPAPLCPKGAVPIVRLTLERLVRYGTLANFFRKSPPVPEGRPGSKK
jgi:hypothetical protein